MSKKYLWIWTAFLEHPVVTKITVCALQHNSSKPDSMLMAARPRATLSFKIFGHKASTATVSRKPSYHWQTPVMLLRASWLSNELPHSVLVSICLSKKRSNTWYSARSRHSHHKGAQVHGAHQAASHVPALYLPSYSRYSFTDPERMEGWASPGPGCKEQLAHGCYATARSQRTPTRDLAATGRAR